MRREYTVYKWNIETHTYEAYFTSTDKAEATRVGEEATAEYGEDNVDYEFATLED